MIWGTYAFPDESFFKVDFGHLHLFLGRRGREWRWTVRYSDDASPAECYTVCSSEVADIPPEAWKRVIVREAATSVVVSPRLPDRPLSIFPREQFQIAQNAQVRLWVTLPLWLHLGSDKGETILELGSMQLSNSWLGDSIGGRMGYTLKTEPRYHNEDEPIPEYCARCRLGMLNQATTPFAVNKIAIPSELLNLYQGAGEMFTSEVKILQTRDQEISVNPLHLRDPKTQVLSTARVRGVDNFWKRSVGLLRRIGNY